jgi:hypothetical protein
MQHGKQLLLSRPFLTRIPADSIIVTDRLPTHLPGAGRHRFVATRDCASTYAMVYAPVKRPFTVRTDVIQGSRLKAWRFNPHDGAATAIGEFPNSGQRTFTPSEPGQLLDRVLVLDNAGKDYPPPGQL